MNEDALGELSAEVKKLAALVLTSGTAAVQRLPVAGWRASISFECEDRRLGPHR